MGYGLAVLPPRTRVPSLLMQWEYTSTEANSSNAIGLAERLNVLGAEGWECVGLSAPDKTLGMNALVAILKREIVAPAPPADRASGWHPDPCGRFDQRYWDGRGWTAHVAIVATKKTAVDAPTLLTPPKPPG